MTVPCSGALARPCFREPPFSRKREKESAPIFDHRP